AARADRLGKTSLADPEKALSAKLTALEEKIINPKIKATQDTLNFTPKLDFQIAALAGFVDSADAKPTASSFARRAELAGELEAVSKEFDGIVGNDLAAFNRAVEEAGIPPVVVLPKKKK
ncbi:MAG TPA: hypothetical protein VL084_08490, partial [Thermoanaerobaculia bacterium]|nr:hypothetical protein [Thermoanaerobaculia bacterium]